MTDADADVICRFMEPAPRKKPNRSRDSVDGWWRLPWTNEWIPRRDLDLAVCHEVEARLSDNQAAKYDRVLEAVIRQDNLIQREDHILTNAEVMAWHTTAEQKIRALADTLDPAREVRGAK